MLSEVIVLQTYRQTDKTENIYQAISRVVKQEESVNNYTLWIGLCDNFY